ncbi:DUF4181 domain-containing protein [Lysinibacillus sp. LZ02]|uniref:DUF4181 domain-containing protein n=1 Tax=Lysinibacillus sp. LZ02 TaxID=3420668 RepID=UPI003D35AE72
MLASLVIGAFIAAGILDLLLRKKFSIETNKKFSDQFLNKGHMVFEILIGVAFLMFISTSGVVGKQLYILLFLFFAMLYAVRALLERLLQREKKKYIISLMYVTICLVCSVGILLVM